LAGVGENCVFSPELDPNNVAWNVLDKNITNRQPKTPDEVAPCVIFEARLLIDEKKKNRERTA